MIILKTAAEIEVMAEAGRRLALIIKQLKDEIRIGVTGIFLEKRARELIREAGAKPAFLGYQPAGSREPYPFSLCISLNNVIVHGRPGDFSIKEGDLVKLDLGLKYKGLFVDSAVTVGVGRISRIAQRLINTTRNALEAAIAEAWPGKTLGDIGAAIEREAKRGGFKVVKNLVGHGIGHNLHEEPAVLNFGKRGVGELLVPGMVLAIEPMIAIGTGKIRQRPDDSFETADGSLSAHFEHTVAITENGPRVLTKIY